MIGEWKKMGDTFVCGAWTVYKETGVWRIKQKKYPELPPVEMQGLYFAKSEDAMRRADELEERA